MLLMNKSRKVRRKKSNLINLSIKKENRKRKRRSRKVKTRPETSLKS